MGCGKGGLGTTNEINLCMLLENVAAKQKKSQKTESGNGNGNWQGLL